MHYLNSEFEKSWEDLVTKDSTSLQESLLLCLLTIASYFYALGMRLRNIAYDLRLLRTHRAKRALLISVGNLTLGGSGKTPFVRLLAQKLLAMQIPTAVVTRGYRSKAEMGQHPLALSIGNGPRYSSEICGDEPFLLASREPRLQIYVGKNRVLGVAAAEKAGCRRIILDDGMQHRRVDRDEDICLVNPLSLESCYLFPRGKYREGLNGLNRSTLIVINPAESQSQFDRAKGIVSRYSDSPVIGVAPIISEILTLDNQLIPSLDSAPVFLFCGISDPKRFEKTVKSTGAIVTGKAFFSDHHAYTQPELASLQKEAQASGAKWLICTEKDRVKLKLDNMNSVPIATLFIELEVRFGKELWSIWQNRIGR